MDHTYNFVSISLVKAPDMKSKWQASFLQIFPFNYSKLPLTHPTDKEFFKTNWKGDSYTTYEQFMGEYYKGWIKK